MKIHEINSPVSMPEICTHEDITVEAARSLRLQLGLSQRTFWGGIGVTVSAGCAYERCHNRMPETVKRLLFLQYVVGIPTDMTVSDASAIAQGSLAKQARTIKKAAGFIDRGLKELYGVHQ